MFQNGRILDLMWNEEKGPSGKELEVNQVVEAYCLSKGKELSFTSLPSKFANFSSFLGLSMVGFEKEITSLLKRMESRKGHGFKVSRENRKFSSTRLEKET